MLVGGTGLALTNFSALGTKSTNERGEEIMATEGQTSGVATAARAFGGQHQPKPLPFNPTKLNGLSEKLIRSHWENNYGGAVKALNAVEQRLQSLLRDTELPAYIYGDLNREELVRTGSVVLHEQYFANLGGDGKAGGKVLDLDQTVVWQLRAVGSGIQEDSERVGRRFWMGDSRSQHAHWRSSQLLGIGPHAQCTNEPPAAGARHV